MIPKIIHTCWFSNDEFPEDVKKCIDSWKNKLPDYEIKVWNLDLLNGTEVNKCQYFVEAIKEKKWAFASDFVRLYVLYNEGGIYLDSDIEVFKTFDSMLNQKAFTGMEDEKHIAAWIFGSEKGNELFKEFINDYENRHFVMADGRYDMTPNPIPITKRLIKHGLDFNMYDKIQRLDYINIYPMDYFCPFNPIRKGRDLFTDNTMCNHHFNGAWRPKNEQISINIEQRLRSKLGYTLAHILVMPFFIYNKIMQIGIKGTIKYSFNKIRWK